MLDWMRIEFQTVESYITLYCQNSVIDKAIDFALSATHDRILIFSDSCSLKAIKSLETTKTNNWVISFVSYLGPTNQTNLGTRPLRYPWQWPGWQSGQSVNQSAGLTGDLDLSIVRSDLRWFLSLIKAKNHLLWQSEWTNPELTNKGKQNTWQGATANRKERGRWCWPDYIGRNFPPECNTKLTTNPVLTPHHNFNK